jgi:PPOX class probable F420-dependent enzyme
MYSQAMSKLTDSARKLLEGKNLLYLGTVNRDGSPHITPVWVDTDGTHVLVNTAVGRVKQKNVTRDPRVTLAMNTPTDFYDVALIKGRVIEQITGPQADKHIDKMAKKYIDKDVYPWHNEKEKRVILKILPERVVTGK